MKRHVMAKGVAALEFALVFPVLFVMLYGLISYSLIFVVQHSLNQAVAEGARASLRYLSTKDNEQMRMDAACQVMVDNLSWLQRLGISVACPPAPAGALTIHVKSNHKQGNVYEMDIALRYQYKQHPLLPRLLPAPEQLTAHAVSQFSL